MATEASKKTYSAAEYLAIFSEKQIQDIRNKIEKAWNKGKTSIYFDFYKNKQSDIRIYQEEFDSKKKILDLETNEIKYMITTKTYGVLLFSEEDIKNNIKSRSTFSFGLRDLGMTRYEELVISAKGTMTIGCQGPFKVTTNSTIKRIIGDYIARIPNPSQVERHDCNCPDCNYKSIKLKGGVNGRYGDYSTEAYLAYVVYLILRPLLIEKVKELKSYSFIPE